MNDTITVLHLTTTQIEALKDCIDAAESADGELHLQFLFLGEMGEAVLALHHAAISRLLLSVLVIQPPPMTRLPI